MRLFSLAIVALLAGCAQTNPGTPPPLPGQPFAGFYYPTGIAFVPDANGGAGFIYVVSSDFDLRYNRGTLAAVDLSTLPLPSSPSSTPTNSVDPHLAAQVNIDVFGGPVAAFSRAGSGPSQRRLFVAGRQNNTLDAVDVDGATLTCARPSSDGGAANDCALSAVQLSDTILDAYRPVVADGQVFVGHLSPVDDPRGSAKLLVSSLARVDAESLGGPDVVPIGSPDTNTGAEAVSAMAAVDGLMVLGGRPVVGANNVVFNGAPLRSFPLGGFNDLPDAGAQTLLLTPQLALIDVRAMALSTDKTRLFLVTRYPDALDVIDVSPGLDGFPRFQVVGVVQMPQGASELTVIPRGPNRRDVVAVTCQTANVVALYDDEIGRVVDEVRGVGDQPFGIAAGTRPGSPNGARLFATAFGRGNVSIIDVPDLDNLASAAVLLNIGPNQNCLNDSASARPPASECPQ